MKHLNIDEIEAMEVEFPIADPCPHDRLIEALRKGLDYKGKPLDFDMSTLWDEHHDKFGDHCGTAACIAGHAAVIMARDTGAERRKQPTSASISEFLGVSSDIAKAMAGTDGMFQGPGGPVHSVIPNMHLSDMRVDQAIRMLEIHRDEGVVDWCRAISECPA